MGEETDGKTIEIWICEESIDNYLLKVFVAKMERPTRMGSGLSVITRCTKSPTTPSGKASRRYSAKWKPTKFKFQHMMVMNTAMRQTETRTIGSMFRTAEQVL